jgi:hypothetical protein
MAAAQIEFDLELDERLRGVRAVSWREVREDRARAVLARMREPDEDMLDAARRVPDLEHISRDQLAKVWRVMIDAAAAPALQDAAAED